MAERTLPNGMVTDIKFKYTCSKSRGTYKGGGGQNSQRAKRKKIGGGPHPVEWVKVLTAGGRVRWDQRVREKRQ